MLRPLAWTEVEQVKASRCSSIRSRRTASPCSRSCSTGSTARYLLLASPGGDGGAAVRLARMTQAACRELVVIVPEMAKSAATILALGAHTIVMGPTSDLGPIDPQILVSERGFVSAKDLIEAVNSALDDVATRPDTYPLHAAMLAGIDSTAVQFARSALASTDELAEQAIGSNPDRTRRDIEKLCARIHRPLIGQPKTHSAVIGSTEARQAAPSVVRASGSQPSRWVRRKPPVPHMRAPRVIGPGCSPIVEPDPRSRAD